MRLQKIFARRELWAIGIYKLDSWEEASDLSGHALVHMIGEEGLRKNTRYQSTVADPFLFVNHGMLYVFYEVKTDHGHGEIWVQSLASDGSWVVHGRVLSESFHLSYPQVFEHHGTVYMLPEAAQSGKVVLYKSVDFPFKWEPCCVLVNEPLLDPTIIFGGPDGIFLLGTTREYELKLYHSAQLLQAFDNTGVVVSRDRSISRCGGSAINVGGGLFRVAQDCSTIYGESVCLRQIVYLSSSGYKEEGCGARLFPGPRPGWMSIGHHHLSCAEFEGAIYVAVDGRRKDLLINTIIFGLLRLNAAIEGSRTARVAPPVMLSRPSSQLRESALVPLLP